MKKRSKKTKKVVRSSTRAATAKVQRFEISDLHDAPYNPRVITDVALKGLTASLQKFGVLSLPVVNVRDGLNRIVGGHQRVRALKEEGATQVDCLVVELPEDEERTANFTLNNQAIEGHFIPELTRAVLARLSELVDDAGVGLLAELRFDVLIRQVQKSITATPGVDDRVRRGKVKDDDLPALGKTTASSKAGELYRLGDHYLYCGVVAGLNLASVFPEVSCHMGFTRLVAKDPFGGDFLDQQIRHLLENVDGAIHIATNNDRLSQVLSSFLALGGHWSNTLIGYHPSKGRAQVAYRDITLPILYGWKGGNQHLFFGDRTQANVWHLKDELPADDVPVEAVVRHVLNSTKKDGTILDVQAGHGATLIAAQKTGRRLLGYVSNAREMDRVRRRWCRFVYGPTADWKTKTSVA